MSTCNRLTRKHQDLNRWLCPKIFPIIAPKVVAAYSRHFGYLFMGHLSRWIRLLEWSRTPCGSTSLDHILVSYKYFLQSQIIQETYLWSNMAIHLFIWPLQGTFGARRLVVAYKHTSHSSNMKASVIVQWLIQLRLDQMKLFETQFGVKSFDKEITKQNFQSLILFRGFDVG